MNNTGTRLNAVILAVASLFVVALTFVPYIALDSNTPNEMTFSGMSTNIPDEASYLMWSRQHAAGALTVHNHMTTMPHDAIMPNPAWLCVGLISGATGMTGIAAYHTARALFSVCYLLLLWGLLKRITGRNVKAWTAWVLIGLGGGIGWMELIGVPVPSADWITELWSWPSMLHYPHFALSLLLTVAALRLWLKAADSNMPDSVQSRLTAVGSGLCLSMLALVHPYTAFTLVFAGVLFYGFWRFRMTKDQALTGKAVRPMPLIGLAALPGFAAMFIQARINPMVAAWAQQNMMPSPPVWEYVAGFGLAGVAAAILTVRICRNKTPLHPAAAFAIFWIGSAMILAYADPLVPFARRCVEGVHIAVVFLAVEFIFSLNGRKKLAAMAITAAFALPMPLAHMIREIRPDNPGYVPDDQGDMLKAVKAHVKDGHIFADPRNSLFIAAATDAYVFVGHHEVSPDFVKKMKTVEQFMTTRMTWDQRKTILRDANCRWIVTDPWTADNVLYDTTFRNPATSVGFKEFARGKSWILVGPAN
jgi:hypothetical protein